ncbi:cytochrome C [Ectothiorhodospiraceae bacterium 2226]|nr:cytochrome C [Ectothiorhodospiraceae bacterium 2226]
MKKVSCATTLLTLVLLFSGPFAAAEEDEVRRAAILSQSCNSCHGPGGYSPGAIPPLQGLSEEVFVRAMQDFKSGARPGTIMNRIARGYRDEDFVLMARYFLAQERR